MPVARAWIDANEEADFIATTNERFRQIRQFTSDAGARDLAARTARHYRKYPWTQPGIAVAFAKWKQDVGSSLAKDLARVAATDPDQVEAYAMTKEFQRQASKYQDAVRPGVEWAAEHGVTRVKNAKLDPQTAEQRIHEIIDRDFGQGWVSRGRPAEPGQPTVLAPEMLETVLKEHPRLTDALTPKQMTRLVHQYGFVPDGEGSSFGDMLRAPLRAAFSVLESPFQEVQAAGSRAAVGVLQGATSGGSRATGWRPGAPPVIATPDLGPLNTLRGGSQAVEEQFGIHTSGDPLQPVSTGAIALEQLVAGEPVDMGTGFFPGGEVQREHVRRVQDIGYFEYGTEPVLDAQGRPKFGPDGQPLTRPQKHFATPGRITAAFVTEPGTLPFQALSGLVDATAVIKADPINPALNLIATANKARRGFDLARETEAAGGFANAWRTFTHGPTVTQWLDSEKGAGVLGWLDSETDFLAVARATNWKLPSKTVAQITATTEPGSSRSILEPLLGVVIENQPQPFSMGAHIRHATQPLRIANVRPEQVIDLRMMDGNGGAVSNVYRWMKNAKVPDDQISPELAKLAGARAAPGQYEALKSAAGVVSTTLVARGVPRGQADQLSRLFAEEVADGARYWVDNIADDTVIPGLNIGGRTYPVDKPHLYVEFLNSKVHLPDHRAVDKALARYGRLFGMEGTGYTESLRKVGTYGEPTLAGGVNRAALRGRYAAYMSNAFLTHVQSSVWVPLQLLRAAWTVRVVGEEQLRIAGAGMDTMLTHPLSNMVELVSGHKGWVRGRKDGLVDTDMIDSLEMQAAMSHDSGKFLGDAAAKKLVAKGKKIVGPDQDGFGAAWADDLIKQNSDPLAGEVARAVRAGAEVTTVPAGSVDVLADVKTRFWDGNLRGMRADLEESGRMVDAFDLSTREGADRYIETVYQRMHEATGGHGPLIEFVAEGRYGDPKTLKAALNNRRVRSADDPTLEGLVVGHRRGGTAARVLYDGAEEPITVLIDEIELLDPSPVRALSRAFDGRSVDKDFVAWLDAMPADAKPGRVVGDVVASSDEQAAIYDRVAQAMFGALMAKPTNWLSRSKTFRQLYWRDVERVMPLADASTRSQIVQAAERVGLPRGQVERLRDIAAKAAMPQADPPTHFRGVRHAADEGGPQTVGLPWWDAQAFATTERKAARLYGDDIEELALQPWAKVLRADTPEFRTLDEAVRAADEGIEWRLGSFEHEQAIARAAADQGYHVVEFADQAMVGTVLLDPAAVGPLRAGGLSLEEIDDLAKGNALDGTRELLYDLNRRSQFFDATRLIFPFGEAWKEVLTTWAKLVVEKPRVLRQFQVGVNGLRGANPFELLPGAVPDHMQHQGFFFKDPASGEESYGYPWSHQISDWAIGMPIPLNGSVKGLNLAFNPMPGVGPVVQVPANAFLDRYAKDPKWDPMRELISPYGSPDTTQGLEAFAPAWMRRWMTATGFGAGGDENARLLNNTVMQVFAYGVSTGDYKTNSPEHIASGMRDAETKARELYKIRGTFQFGGPSAPTPQFLVESKGKLVQLAVLRDELRRLEEQDYDSATAKFIDRFGEKAFYATGPMTLSNAYAIPVTDEALDWSRRNPKAAEKFPSTYGFFAPPGGEFDYTAYLRSIATGEREPVDPEEWVRRSNHVLGTIWYDRVRQDMGLERGETGDAKQRAYLNGLREAIRDDYPGWRDIDFDENKVPHAIEELDRASRDRTLRAQSPELTGAIRTYMKGRTQAIKQVEAAGGTSEFGRPGFDGKKYTSIRLWLFGLGEAISKDTPEFAPMWEQVFSREIPDEEPK